MAISATVTVNGKVALMEITKHDGEVITIKKVGDEISCDSEGGVFGLQPELSISAVTIFEMLEGVQ